MGNSHGNKPATAGPTVKELEGQVAMVESTPKRTTDERRSKNKERRKRRSLKSKSSGNKVNLRPGELDYKRIQEKRLQTIKEANDLKMSTMSSDEKIKFQRKRQHRSSKVPFRDSASRDLSEEDEAALLMDSLIPKNRDRPMRVRFVILQVHLARMIGSEVARPLMHCHCPCLYKHLPESRVRLKPVDPIRFRSVLGDVHDVSG